ncbi:hypothetical protein AgCh_005893 [Apium graveolens]
MFKAPIIAPKRQNFAFEDKNFFGPDAAKEPIEFCTVFFTSSMTKTEGSNLAWHSPGNQRACIHTRSRARKRTLDQAEEEAVVIQREVFKDKEKVEEEEKVEEPTLVVMGDQAEIPKALMDYSPPNINDIQLSIIRPAISANTFEIKSSTIQMIQNSVQFGGSPTEDPNMHIRDFIEICDTFKFNGVTEYAIKLRLFLLSLRDKAK